MSNRPPPGPPPPVVPVADVDEARSSLAEVSDALESTIARAAGFTEAHRNQSVNDEWSTIESFRHIVFVIDVWLGKAICGEADPFHPIGLPPHFMPAEMFGLDTGVRPSFDEACDAMRGRLGVLRGYVDALTADELVRPIQNHAKTAGGGLSVIFTELKAHNLFINRDLNLIEAG